MITHHQCDNCGLLFSQKDVNAPYSEVWQKQCPRCGESRIQREQPDQQAQPLAVAEKKDTPWQSGS